MRLLVALSFALFLLTLPHAAHAQSTADEASPDETPPDEPQPVRVGVVGLVHTHVHWILGREDRGDIEIVGIVEPNRDLAERYAEQHGYAMDLVYADLDAMLDAAQPEAVTVFTTIKDHRAVVERAAARGIHVLVEKPLAISLDDARAMAEAAEAAGIHLLTNYETTWYPSVHETQRRVDAGDLGPLRKIVVHDGHQGPQEIGVNEEFLDWLIDPEFNGAGALFDFGCYGAGLATWLLDGQRPTSVTAVTQQIKPDVYPLVDDEATIILTYPEAQAIVQASWNWPFNRKDMEVYGRTGFAHADDATTLRVRLEGEDAETRSTVAPLPVPHDDPFAYLAAVVRGEVEPGTDLSSLPTNLIVMEILDAALRSAQTGETVRFD
ncbi:MAG: Gfo/Idh/MocA family oxidoreductase [Bacteroidota bacterium]